MRVLLVAVLLVSALAHLPAQTQPARIVAIGDIHGAYDEFVTILTRAGLVDDKLAWSGGRTTLVQTGDYTDRGAGVKQVMDLLMRLEREAKSAGGQVLTLLGNHEVMNLIGDWRDVTPEICATFSKGGMDDDCSAYREAMSPRGPYGRWLRGKDIAARIGGTLFMHAGINPARAAPRSIDDVNERTRAEIRRLDQYRQRLVRSKLARPSDTLQQVLDVTVAQLQSATQALTAAKSAGTPPPDLDVALLREAQAVAEIATWNIVDPEGPLWFRGYAQWDERETAPSVFALLDAMKLSRIVVGHSVTGNRRISPRYDGRVLLIDTGMLTRAYKGTPSALEITGASLKAIYPDGEQPLP